MLESEQLDGTRYRDLYERAVKMIPALAPDWTDLSPHDPGVTILETMALLSDMQNYTCNLVGSAHLQKYLELFGAQPEGIRPAGAHVTVRTPEEPVLLPKGSLFQAEELPFETEEALVLCENHLRAVLAGTEGRLREQAMLLEGRDGRGMPVLAEEGEALYLGFERPLEPGRELSLFARTGECPRRNPVRAGMRPTADLVWESWGREGWSAAAVRDETAALLTSGLLRFTVRCPMEPLELGGRRLYFLRARLSGGGYDLPPVLKRLRLNVLPLVQRRTLAETVELSGTPPWRVSSRLCREGTAKLFIPEAIPEGVQEAGERWRELSEGFHWVEGASGTRLLCPDGPCGNRARLVCADPEYHYPKGVSGVTSQRVPLLLSGVQPETLGLMLRGRDGLWRDCRIFLYPPGGGTVRNGCLFLPDSGELLFGDGRDFAIPAPVEDGLLLTGLSVTLGSGGNAAALSIRTGPVECVNEEPAAGGRNPETVETAIEALRERLRTPQRAVTCADLRRLALATPGLALHKASAFPLERLGRGKTGLAVAVKPWGNGRPPLAPWAAERVREYLEPARLLTVRLEVLSPRYLPVRVRVRAALLTGGLAREQELRQLIRELTDGVEGGLDFGETVSHARLFSALSALAFVQTVEELGLELGGAAGRKLRNGDLQPEPDTLTWLESCQLLLK